MKSLRWLKVDVALLAAPYSLYSSSRPPVSGYTALITPTHHLRTKVHSCLQDKCRIHPLKLCSAIVLLMNCLKFSSPLALSGLAVVVYVQYSARHPASKASGRNSLVVCCCFVMTAISPLTTDYFVGLTASQLYCHAYCIAKAAKSL